jgi:hypothetical protein
MGKGRAIKSNKEKRTIVSNKKKDRDQFKKEMDMVLLKKRIGEIMKKISNEKTKVEDCNDKFKKSIEIMNQKYNDNILYQNLFQNYIKNEYTLACISFVNKIIVDIKHTHLGQYEGKYNLNKIGPLENILESIFSLIGIKCSNSNNNLSQENLQFYSKMISEISSLMNSKIKDILEKYEINLNDKSLQELLNSEITKSYKIQGLILSKLEEFNKEIKNYFINQYMNNYLLLTEKILNLFCDNDKLINIIFDFYTNIANVIEINSQNSIEYINKLFSNFFIAEKAQMAIKVY